jgi:hypothetical protein
MPPEPNGSNGAHPSTLGVVNSIGGKVVAGLGAPFLALVLLNVIFLSAVFWYEAHQTAGRLEMVAKLIDACAQAANTAHTKRNWSVPME